MSENAETKVCPFCAETIKAAARKCPHCNSRLFRYAFHLQEFLLGLACLYCVGGVAFSVYWALPEDTVTGGRSFARHRDELTARDVSVAAEDHGTHGHYYIASGFVTNKGNYPWRVENVELTISNAQGVTDVFHDEVEKAFVVQAHSKHPFVLKCRTSMTNEVLSASARVENARDGNVQPKDN